jgi:CheY-like chemotaxis protein
MEQPIHLLLVEDDEIEVEALARAFRSWRIAHTLTVATDGLEALDALQGHPHDMMLATRRLILLDLNLPRMGGLEFLRVLRRDPVLRNSVVFVWTTSNHEQDIRAAYDNAVAGYFVKFRAGPQMHKLLSMLEAYCQMAEFPPPA